MELGTWTLWEADGKSIVAESTEQSVVVYLWHKGVGILGHVWLFNQETDELSINDGDMRVPQNTIVSELAYPQQVDQLFCELSQDDGAWVIGWDGLCVATIDHKGGVGRSILIREDNDLALSEEQERFSKSTI
ncbi:hypothetical protein [Actibacterium mucosum]|nr:hypothetical protein [Actibacterium mucosum]